VTHLAQVAAFADHHVVVRKDVAGATGIGVTDVRALTGDERTAELARMLGGSDTATARRHAAELLAAAGDNAAESGAAARAARR
jgi:DNA repair protein RecN (Recombination protein N)